MTENQSIKRNKARLFLGYLLYTQTKGREIIRQGGNPTKVLKFKNYLMEELNYTEVEAEEIQKQMRWDLVDERKNKNRK